MNFLDAFLDSYEDMLDLAEELNLKLAVERALADQLASALSQVLLHPACQLAFVEDETVQSALDAYIASRPTSLVDYKMEFNHDSSRTV